MLVIAVGSDFVLFWYVFLCVTQYMEQEGNQSLVEFWLAAVNFEQHLRDKKGDYDSVEVQNDAIVLYDKWVCTVVGTELATVLQLRKWDKQWKDFYVWFVHFQFKS